MRDAQAGASWRSMLYVPANRDRFVQNATTAGADAVILDLEDAVPADHKNAARDGLADAVATLRTGPSDVLVRVNRPWAVMVRDLEAAVAAAVDAVIIPKSADAGMIRTVDEILSDLEAERAETGSAIGREIGVIPLIESARGVRNADEIVSASGRVIAASTGIGDLCLDMHTAPNSTAVLHAFTDVIQATRAAGRTPLGLAGLIVSFEDIEAFHALATRSRDMGSTGASCIHPRQIAPLNHAFSPSPEELEHARRVVAAYEGAARDGRGSVMLGRVFIDNANYRHSQRLLARSEASQPT